MQSKLKTKIQFKIIFGDNLTKMKLLYGALFAVVLVLFLLLTELCMEKNYQLDFLELVTTFDGLNQIYKS